MNEDTIKSLSDEILKRVDALGDVVTNGAADVFALLIHYYFISGLAHLGICALAAAVGVWGARSVFKGATAAKAAEGYDYDGSGLTHMIGGGVATLAGTIAFTTNIYNALMRTFAPDGVAILNLIQMLK